MVVKNELSIFKLREVILKALDQIKAESIVHFDLSKCDNAVCKEFLVCSGNSTTHVRSIAQFSRKFVSKQTKQKPFSVEGESLGNWILMDYVDIVVHIFLPEIRSYYDLESFWQEYQRELPNF